MENHPEILKDSTFTAHPTDSKSDLFYGDIERSKTPLRIRYESEVMVIRRQLGTLEEMRLKLGLSRRKICQLLLVDPSAWTRWSKEDSAPPHIYRSMEWYMLLTKEAPAQAHSYWIATVQGQTRQVDRPGKNVEFALKTLENELDLTRKKIRHLQIAAAVMGVAGLLGWLVAVLR